MSQNSNNIVLKAGLLALSCTLSACDTDKNGIKQTETNKQAHETPANTSQNTASTSSLNNETNMFTKLPSGLEYKITQAAPDNAQSPTAGKKVTVHYTGWLWNNGTKGTKFDSSVDRGQKFEFTIGVGQVIKGWDEGVMGMKVGEKRELIIPANLGYGARGAGGAIPGGATLMFEVELFKVG
jgi:FKBP-type peptidyl-prolyl cis-trans isomerase